MRSPGVRPSPGTCVAKLPIPAAASLRLPRPASTPRNTRCMSTAGMETKASRLDVTFSSLLSKNIDQLKMFNAAIFPIKYQDGFYRECCAAGDVTQLAFYQEALIGAIACRLELQKDFTAKMYVMTIGVLAPYRGLGLGRQLIERSIAAAQEDPNIKSAYLHVQSTNQEAASFYKKFGFEEAGVVKDYYKLADGRDALILTRSLEPPPDQE